MQYRIPDDVLHRVVQSDTVIPQCGDQRVTCR